MSAATTASAAPIPVGFLGCGFIAELHASMLAGCREANQITAVYDTDRERCASFATKWGAAPAASEDEVFDRCEAVFICTWTSEHRRLAVRAATRGRHVFCEKPLAFDSADAAAMVEAVKRTQVVNSVGLVLRSTPAMRTLRELTRDPSSGRVMSIVFRDDQYIPIQGMYASDWRGDRERAGRGVLLEHSIHDLDLLEWLAGPIARVAATQSFYHDIAGIEDAVAVVAQFESGANATLSTLWHDVTSRPSQRRIEVFCERALITLEDEWSGPVHVERDAPAGAIRQTIQNDELSSWLERRGIQSDWPHDSFLRAIREGGSATPSFADALRAHRIADAIYLSAENDGRSFAVPK